MISPLEAKGKYTTQQNNKVWILLGFHGTDLKVIGNFPSFKGNWHRHEHNQYYPNSSLGKDRRFEWRKKESRLEHNNASSMKPSYPSVIFPDHYLEAHIDLLKDTTLIGMFGPSFLPLSLFGIGLDLSGRELRKFFSLIRSAITL